MKRLWAPWREDFILGKKEKGCIFCNRSREKKDKKNLILYRGKSCFVILNRYPYNVGHMMVVPFRHIKRMESLNEREALELMQLSQQVVKALQKFFKPHGLNLGININRASGAGVAGHLHMHIVPRWNGDTNFLPVLADTKLLSVSLQNSYQKLTKYWNKVAKNNKSEPQKNS